MWGFVGCLHITNIDCVCTRVYLDRPRTHVDTRTTSRHTHTHAMCTHTQIYIYICVHVHVLPNTTSTLIITLLPPFLISAKLVQGMNICYYTLLLVWVLGMSIDYTTHEYAYMNMCVCVSVIHIHGYMYRYTPSYNVVHPKHIRTQLRRIQSFLKKDISSGYVDRHGRARRAPCRLGLLVCLNQSSACKVRNIHNRSRWEGRI